MTTNQVFWTLRQCAFGPRNNLIRKYSDTDVRILPRDIGRDGRPCLYYHIKHMDHAQVYGREYRAAVQDVCSFLTANRRDNQQAGNADAGSG